jgi:hypothetical protein
VKRVAFLIVLIASFTAEATRAAGPRVRVDEVLDADAYPTLTTAAEALAGRWARQAVEAPAEIRLNAAAVPPDVRDAVSAALQRRFPQARVTFDPNDRSADRVSWSAAGEDRHRLSLGTFSTEACDKRWVIDAGAVRRSAKSNDLFVVARSDGPCADAAAATESARRALTRALVPVVRSDAVARRISNELPMRPEWVADRFVQRFERPYGTVWQEAILVKVPRGQVDAMAASMAARERQVRHERAGGVVAVGGALVAIWLIYLLANMLTRGYFVWRLRAATAMAAIALGLAAVLWVAART